MASRVSAAGVLRPPWHHRRQKVEGFVPDPVTHFQPIHDLQEARRLIGVEALLRPHWRTDAHAVAHMGAIDALLWNLRTLVAATGDAIDAQPVGEAHVRQQRAMRIRHIVAEAVDEILDRIPRALGPGPLALEPDVHRHMAEADLYRRQSHAERDLESLGELSRTLGL